MIRHPLLVTLLVAGLLLTGTARAQDATSELLRRINELRGSVGLPGYTLNGALAAAAQSQAQWMADTGMVSHVRGDGSGPRSRAVNAGYGTADVSENIYAGTNATINSAWTFWINSAIHYAGLTNPRYSEVGIGAARGADYSAYVLVFGNPGGPAPYTPIRVDTSGGSAAAAPPSFVKGIDPRGFIMHEVQPGDTLGDIALLYGYSWGDIPYMREVNAIENHYNLEVGSIFLVPPYEGTYTPTPGDPQTVADASTPEAAAAEPSATPMPSPTPSPTRPGIATAIAMPEVIALPLNAIPTTSPTPPPTAVAQAATPVLMSGGGTITRSSGPSPWLVAGLALQIGLVLIAGVEFVRRSRRSSR
jgi:hypothetical protein